MALQLYFHPLSSFSQKVLIALYENDTPFEPRIVHFGDAESRKEFFELWPIGKIPALNDTTRDWFVPETSIIIEYLDQHYPGETRFIPQDADIARQMRLRDRFFDLYIDTPMGKIVTDRIRPDGQRDPFGVDEARRLLSTALELVDKRWPRRSLLPAAPSAWRIAPRHRRSGTRTKCSRSRRNIRTPMPTSNG